MTRIVKAVKSDNHGSSSQEDGSMNPWALAHDTYFINPTPSQFLLGTCGRSAAS